MIAHDKRTSVHPVAQAGNTKDHVASRIRILHGKILTSTRNTLRAALEIGKLLHDKKVTLGHGNFERWKKAHLEDIGSRTARRYMELHRNRATIEAALKTDSVTDLTDAYHLIHNASKAAEKANRDVPSPDPYPHGGSPSSSEIEDGVILQESKRRAPPVVGPGKPGNVVEDAVIVREEKATLLASRPEPRGWEAGQKSSNEKSARDLLPEVIALLEKIDVLLRQIDKLPTSESNKIPGHREDLSSARSWLSEFKENSQMTTPIHDSVVQGFCSAWP